MSTRPAVISRWSHAWGWGLALRERGARRAVWLGLAGASGIGLWFSESRSARGACGGVLIVAALWMATVRFSTRVRTAALAVIVLAPRGGALVRVRLLDADPTLPRAGSRAQFFPDQRADDRRAAAVRLRHRAGQNRSRRSISHRSWRGRTASRTRTTSSCRSAVRSASSASACFSLWIGGGARVGGAGDGSHATGQPAARRRSRRGGVRHHLPVGTPAAHRRSGVPVLDAVRVDVGARRLDAAEHRGRRRPVRGASGNVGGAVR